MRLLPRSLLWRTVLLIALVIIVSQLAWLALVRQAERKLPVQWIGWGALSIALALLGAWFIVWRVSRPLKALAGAAEQVGRGQQPTPLPEQGPEEIRTLTRQFNQMNRDLERLNRERTVMLAGISHDLRTPLARLRLAVELLEGKVDAASHPGMIEDIADLDAIVGQFLAFARGAEVLICTWPAGAEVFLSVLDRGPGIAPEQAALATQPFARLDSARGDAGGGLEVRIALPIR